jgi:hypothetical protein
VPDAGAHLRQALRAVGLAEELPGFGYPERGETTVEAAADDPVVRAVRLEEEGLADG